MAFKDLTGKSASELRSELLELRREQFNLRMQRGTGQLASPARFKVVRREIARIKTRMNQLARSQS
jgi:large subunit ribosomal protein L29